MEAHLARTWCQKPSPAPSTSLLPVKGEGCRPCVAPGRQESAAETAELNKSRARYAWCGTSAGSYLQLMAAFVTKSFSFLTLEPDWLWGWGGWSLKSYPESPFLIGNNLGLLLSLLLPSHKCSPGINKQLQTSCWAGNRRMEGARS